MEIGVAEHVLACGLDIDVEVVTVFEVAEEVVSGGGGDCGGGE